MLNDQAGTGDDTYNFLTSNVFRKGTLGHTVTAGGFASYTLIANRGNDLINANGNTPITVQGNDGNDVLDAQGSGSGLNPPKPNVTFDGGAGLDTVNVNTGNVGNATVKFVNTQDLGWRCRSVPEESASAGQGQTSS